MQVSVVRLALLLTSCSAFSGGAWFHGLSLQAEAAEPRASTSPADELAARQDILDSAEWRRAMFEVNEWLTRQSVYTPEQVDEMREEFRQRVAEMDAAELKLLLGDLETKLQILDNPQVREARAWMAEYVAVLSTRKREEVLRDLPNLARLTPGQLHQEVVRIKQKRSGIDSRQAAFGASQAQRVASQVRANQAASRNVGQVRSNRPATLSPYRSPSNVNERLNTAPNDRPAFFVNAFGGVGRALPSSW